MLSATRYLAAGHPDTWEAGVHRIAAAQDVSPALVRSVLSSAVVAWNGDPLRAVAAWSLEAADNPRRVGVLPASPRDEQLGPAAMDQQGFHLDEGAYGEPSVKIGPQP